MEEYRLPPSGRDYFIVNGASLVSDVDLNVVVRLYQPIIGHKATILYFTLVDYSKVNESELLPHQEIYDYMQISPRDFIHAREILEACGLLKSFVKSNADYKNYTYVIYSPKSPKDFFDDVLFKGLLIKFIGEKNTTKLASTYKTNINLKDYKDVSASFIKVFQPDLDSDCFKVNINENLKDTKAIKVDTDFSLEEFFNQLKVAHNISSKAFSNKELNEIERISTLYGLNMVTICSLVSECFNETNKVGEKVDLNNFKERAINEAKYLTIYRKNKENKTYIKISGRTALANDIDLMENLSPRAYLQNRQDGAPAVTADLKLFDYLSLVMQLNNGVINALVSYCLKNCDNRLDRNYVEKVASSLKREKISSALDAINYLENRTSKNTSKKINNKKSEKKLDNDDFDLDEYNSLLDSVTKK